MTQENFADLVLILHFGIVIFIISLFVIIPVGYRFKWNWPRNRKLRSIHLFLIFLVTTETVFGLTCPLTLIEHNLRGIFISNTFVNSWLQNLLYWNFSKEFFLTSYILCLMWTIFMWNRFPPSNKKKVTR